MKGPSKEIHSKSTMCDLLLMGNSNRGPITHCLQNIIV